MMSEKMSTIEARWWSQCFCHMAKRHLAKAQLIRSFDPDQLERLKSMVNSSSRLVQQYAEDHPDSQDLKQQLQIIISYREQINQL